MSTSTFRVCRMTGFEERVKELVVEAPVAAVPGAGRYARRP